MSYSYGTSVTGVVLERLPATLLLTGAAFLVGVAIALPLGIVAALRRNSAGDYGARRVRPGVAELVATLGERQPPP